MSVIIPTSKIEIIKLARELKHSNCLILDAETTGLSDRDEVIEVAVIDMQGEVLLDELVMPTQPIPNESREIHGISDRAVRKHGQLFEYVALKLASFNSRQIAMFNAVFDVRLLKQSAERHAWRLGDQAVNSVLSASVPTNTIDIMELANRYFYESLEWDAEQSKFKRLSLSKCCELIGLNIEEEIGNPHQALVDCKATRELILYMADKH